MKKPAKSPGAEPAPPERIRLSMVVTPQTKERVERLLVLSEAESMADVVRNALLLYERALTRVANGEKFLIERPDGSVRELELV